MDILSNYPVKMMDGIFILLMSSLLMSVTGSVFVTGLVPAVQVVPERIESVNGSNTTVGCASLLVDEGSGTMMVCNSSESYLVDSCSPAIDTSTSNWASQLVTLRGNDGDVIIEEVVLTFVFDTAVSLDRIELDMFLCPEWKIGASYIAVYGDENSTLVYSDKSTRIGSFSPHSSSCDSLSPVTFTVGDNHRSSSYHTWHIVVEATLDNEWVYVGEVRFLDGDSTPTPKSCSTEMTTTSNIPTYSTAIISSYAHEPINTPAPTFSPTTIYTSTLLQLESTSVLDGRENDCTCSQQQPTSVPECSNSALIGVSAASLLMTVTLTIIIITQCLLMVRMRKSKDVVQRNETYTEVMIPTTMKSDIPVTTNEAYALHNITGGSEEVTYELVK